MKKLVILGVLAVSGCTTPQTEVIYLANSAGQKAQCGPYFRGIGSNYTMNVAEQNLRDCVNDYQKQGYSRTPGP